MRVARLLTTPVPTLPIVTRIVTILAQFRAGETHAESLVTQTPLLLALGVGIVDGLRENGYAGDFREIAQIEFRREGSAQLLELPPKGSRAPHFVARADADIKTLQFLSLLRFKNTLDPG